jgi:nucleoid-associated protein YgaU
LFIALAGLVVIGIAIGLSLWSEHRDQVAPAPQTTAQPQTTAPAPQKPSQPGIAPSFDIVRINPQGETVMAGRAAPKAEVTVLDGGQEIGRVTADNRGEWVFVPDKPLASGNRELTLRATNPDGSTTETESAVVLAVPDRATDKQGAPLAIKVNPDGSIEIMQGARDSAGEISIAGVKYDDQGHLSIAGNAAPKARVQVYVDNQPAGTAEADAEGRWHLTPQLALQPGDHKVRAQQLGKDGKVAGEAEIALGSAGTAPLDSKITVVRGNSLWRIARRTYGSGFDYVVIFQANKELIRNPDLIYPGQVLAVPSSHR